VRTVYHGSAESGRKNSRKPCSGLDGFLSEPHGFGVTGFRLIAFCLAVGTLTAAEPSRDPPEKFRNDNDFLELLQRRAFDYFWLEANPSNGLVRDRSRANSYCSIAAVGFGLTAIGIGIDHR